MSLGMRKQVTLGTGVPAVKMTGFPGEKLQVSQGSLTLNEANHRPNHDAQSLNK